jgi:release factor glutamine methyltransferase
VLDLASVTRALERAGCVAAGAEAAELVAAAADGKALRQMLARRETGEPLAWITGRTTFCGLDVAVQPGVYVPRWQTEPLARLAARLLPPGGVGVDLCTGAGAVGLFMQRARPASRVVATEIEPVAAACARRNGLVVFEGHLDEPLPIELASRVDVMTGVLPYVPSDAFHLLPRDVASFEPRRSLDGGDGGVALVSAAVRHSPRWVKAGGWLLLEVGGDQVGEVTSMMTTAGYGDIEVLEDEDGDPRGIAGRKKGGDGERPSPVERPSGPTLCDGARHRAPLPPAAERW